MTGTELVSEIALQQPAAIGVFEKFGIDYCCGGHTPLANACATKQLDLDSVIVALEAAANRVREADRDWTVQPLAALCDYIVATHHSYCKREIPRLSGLAAKVANKHGGRSPELAIIQAKWNELVDGLSDHLAEEEVVVFPYIARMENQANAGGTNGHPIGSQPGGPISALIGEHEWAGELLAEIRGLSHDFTPPGYACTSYQAFYEGLKAFESDLHRHVHLENNVLFPRATQLEETQGAGRPN
jgi:regulator of cell morphogenesis and NO signaling